MSGAYTRELVEQLMPAVWDRDAARGMTNPTAPDPDMPRAKPNPKQSNTLYAHLADIHTAWHSAPLTLAERHALFFRYALDLPHTAIGVALGIRRQSATERIDSGIGRIVACLNGE
ncbi:hypothetical protein AB0J80_36210 [Actinoplanes sp. NPDC049548]|uniref:hypothetical protein n=1 Tax=Actinoplanes sp. NPDC049548 TaxID=3155152 RepID=UPI0034268804